MLVARTVLSRTLELTLCVIVPSELTFMTSKEGFGTVLLEEM